jgi:hypothetical protein
LLAENVSVRAVGFGVDGSEGDFPDLKRSGTMQVAHVTPDGFDTTPAPAMTCTGDSGGPLLVTDAQGLEQLVGITVAGDPGCQSVAHNQRLDALQSDFVAPFMLQARPHDALGGCGFAPIRSPPPWLALAVLLCACWLRRVQSRRPARVAASSMR